MPNAELKKIAATELAPLRDRIADSIRTSIIDGRVNPGERLTEPDVARQLGVSRTPVREAFFLLISEGFVEAAPRRGVVVADLSPQDAEETYVLKGALEALAATLAAGKVSQQLTSVLELINEELRESIEVAPVEMGRVLDLNNRFHQTLSDACGNRKLSRLVTVYRRQTLRYNYIYFSDVSRLRQSVEEHRTMIMALRRKDVAEVGRLVRLHNDAALRSLRSIMAVPAATDRTPRSST
ncbi:MAG: GntR family transcriptional regulator [Bacteroidetes bacterium]|jgi:DNA-binding GntR family transcriptional regulator|nr:GntR family transcriptional regulator [Bacteroidota bacterium]